MTGNAEAKAHFLPQSRNLRLRSVGPWLRLSVFLSYQCCTPYPHPLSLTHYFWVGSNSDTWSHSGVWPCSSTSPRGWGLPRLHLPYTPTLARAAIYWTVPWSGYACHPNFMVCSWWQLHASSIHTKPKPNKTLLRLRAQACVPTQLSRLAGGGSLWPPQCVLFSWIKYLRSPALLSH